MPKRRATGRKSDAQLKELLNAIEDERSRERAAFRSMVAAFRNATPIERAEGCLQFWAQQIAEWGDHEATVYLISRGNDCSPIIRTIQSNWRQAATDSVERFIAGDIIDQKFAQSVRKDPTEFFSRFWGFFDSQELSIDATMLRAAQWCNIHGYEQWWRALERDLRGNAFSGGGHPFLLFNYSRADHAIETMSEGLRLSLDAIETLSLPRSTPWWRSDGNLGCAIR